MFTSLVEKYDIYFNLQAKRRSVHVNGYCGTELNFGTDCCIGHPTKISYMPSSKKSIFKSYGITKQEMLQYVTDAPEGPLGDTPSHYVLSFCDVSLNLLQ